MVFDRFLLWFMKAAPNTKFRPGSVRLDYIASNSQPEAARRARARARQSQPTAKATQSKAPEPVRASESQQEPSQGRPGPAKAEQTTPQRKFHKSPLP